MSSALGDYLVKPKVGPPLDPHFCPAALAYRAYVSRASEGSAIPVEFALERSSDSVSRFRTSLPDNRPLPEQFFHLERLLKFLLWSRGATQVYFSGPETLFVRLERHFLEARTGRFDAEILGANIYERPFTLTRCRQEELPAEKELALPLGRNIDGARIGFDLGASDRKVAAVLDGITVFTEEIPWAPALESDPQWHFDQIMQSLQSAARHLPRVDAIGGSAAGVYVKNKVKIASLFRAVSPEDFQAKIHNLFLTMQAAWGNIPFEVVNDGEVTALAGSMLLGTNRVLGIAMGSSEAAGYVDGMGSIRPWLNELAFGPIDYSPQGQLDEWSGEVGCGAQYLSQQAVGRLLELAGISLPSELTLPEKLVEVQIMANQGNIPAIRIFETIGVYFGYALAHYSQFYDLEHCLVLGRVTSGIGGGVIVEQARRVLQMEFPDLAPRLQIHLPDEKQKRLGQAAAAASLPVIKL